MLRAVEQLPIDDGIEHLFLRSRLNSMTAAGKTFEAGKQRALLE
jgi:hypothetical protein